MAFGVGAASVGQALQGGNGAPAYKSYQELKTSLHRDLLNKVAGRKLDWSECRVADFMTRDPETLRPDDRIVWALNLMHVGGYRHVPLVDAANRPVGVISIKDIVQFIVELFPAAVLNLPPDPRQTPDPFSGGGED